VSARGPIDPATRIGHVHLRCSDIDRVRAFYVDILGFEVTLEERGVSGWGQTGDVLFLHAGDYHHHLGFNTWLSAGGGAAGEGATGLHHIAINYPTQAALADALARLREAGWPIRTTIDHGTHLALYLADPDGNGLELAWDRPPAQWPRDARGQARFDVRGAVDEQALLEGRA
jgi:catechol 2,3-dioxygenase